MPEADYVVVGEDEILRRVKLPPLDRNENDLIKTLPNGKKQITRLAFRPDPKRDKNGLSVNIIGLVVSGKALYDPSSHLAVKILAQKCFDLGLTIDHDPLADDHNEVGYSHALIKDLISRKDIQATLAEQCQII